MKNPLDLIKSFGEQEDKLTESEFVSPVFGNRIVATRISGVVYTFSIPKADPGWYCFQPVDFESAKPLREADFDERSTYLSRLPKLRVVLSHRMDNVYYALPEKNNRFGFKETDILSVFLVDDFAQDFDVAVCRFDGDNIWFHEPDMNNDLAKGDYLRQSFEGLVDVDEIHFSGLTLEEKCAYAVKCKMDKELKEKLQKRTIETAVTHGGGKLVRFKERADSFSVTFSIEGQQYTAHVTKDPGHNIISAGICLSGDDQKFDLKSFVGIAKDGQDRGLIHRTR